MTHLCVCIRELTFVQKPCEIGTLPNEILGKTCLWSSGYTLHLWMQVYLNKSLLVFHSFLRLVHIFLDVIKNPQAASGPSVHYDGIVDCQKCHPYHLLHVLGVCTDITSSCHSSAHLCYCGTATHVTHYPICSSAWTLLHMSKCGLFIL